MTARQDTMEFDLCETGTTSPAFARVHHHADPHLTPSEAARWLLAAHRIACDGQYTVPLVVTGAAFGKADLAHPTEKRYPNSLEFAQCIAAAQAWLSVLDSELGPELACAMLFGLDVYARSHRTAPDAVAQFVAHRPAGGRNSQLIGAKRLPTSEEERFVYVYPDDHGLPMRVGVPGFGSTVALVCHDTTAYFPRSEATTRTDWRWERRCNIKNDVTDGAVQFIFNAIHRLPSVRTFATSYHAISQANPSLTIIGAFGVADAVSRAKILDMASQLTVPSSSSLESIPFKRSCAKRSLLM